MQEHYRWLCETRWWKCPGCRHDKETMKEQKLYIIKKFNKRYNNKTFTSYNAAKAAARRIATRLRGFYADATKDVGLTVVAK